MFRISNNSRVDHSYQSIEVNDGNKESSSHVTTPVNVSSGKPLHNSSQESPTSNDRMVSPKRKVEHFPHLYAANNVKTSTFNEQTDNKSNKNNLMNNHDYNKYCPHTAINMVPERDTGPLTSGAVSTVGSLRLPACQNLSTSKYNGDIKSDEHRKISNRPHHHVSVQELRLQVCL